MALFAHPPKQNVVVNSPIYDIKCRYFNTQNGCYYGEFCKYKHIINYQQQTPYQTLIQYHIMTKNLLNQLLSMLQSLTVPLPATKSTEIRKEEFALELKSESPSELTSPQLNSNSPTPIPKPAPTTTKNMIKAKKQKANLFLRALARTPSPEPAPKIDHTPTAKYFESTNQSSGVIASIQEKALFAEWVVKYIAVDVVDEEIIDNIVSKSVCGGFGYDDIITGNKAVLFIEKMLNSFEIKYRKILNINRETDLWL